LICGEDETVNHKVTVKRMFGDEGERFMQQETIALEEAIRFFVDIDDLEIEE
jgi:hypothetical protein